MRKVLVVTDSFLPMVDGVTRFTGDVLNSLSKDFDFKLLAPDYGLRLKDYNGIKITYFPTTRFITIRAGLDYHPVIPNLVTIMKEVKKSDVVFVQSLPYLGASAIRAAKMLKKPVAMYFHQIAWEQLKLVTPGSAWFKDLARFFALNETRKYCNMCDIILVPSAEIMDVLNEAGIKAKKAVVSMGVDTKRFTPTKNKSLAKKRLGIGKNSIVIGYCGRMSDEKNVITLIRAFLRLSKRKKNIYLLLVGGGERFEKYTLRNRNIKITGFVSDVVPYYQAMDIFVMPSLTETTGLSTLEAMSSGVPIITTPVGIALSAISNGYNGLIFGKKDVRGLASKLSLLVESRSLRQKLSKNGRKTVIDSYSWDKTAEEVKKVLSEL